MARPIVFGFVWFCSRRILLHNHQLFLSNIVLWTFWQPVVRTMDSAKIRTIFEYEFRLGTTGAETARRINAAYGEGSTNEHTVRNWFRRFRDGNFDLTNEPRGRPESKLNNDDVRAVMEADPRQSAAVLAARFKVSKRTMLTHLEKIGTVKKLDKWIPHLLTDEQKRRRVDACLSLLTRHENEPFLDRIVTCDEKWIRYDNLRRSYQWVNQDEPGCQYPKQTIHVKKLMLSVWWTSPGVIHYSFMKPGTSITADVYCQQLEEMMREMAAKQPKLVNRTNPLLLQDNPRPHTS